MRLLHQPSLRLFDDLSIFERLFKRRRLAPQVLELLEASHQPARSPVRGCLALIGLDEIGEDVVGFPPA